MEPIDLLALSVHVVTSDYEQMSATLTFTGTQQQSVFVDLVNDSIFEGSEYFEGHLSEGANFPDFVTLEPAEVNATITNDDRKYMQV